jgi:hypothetical protein
MHQRPVNRGGRTQNYYVSPVRYTLSGGGDDPARWGAQLAGALYLVTGTLLIALLVLPLLGALGNALMMAFAPFWGVLGLVTRIPTDAEPWVLPAIATAFLAIGLGIMGRWRIAHLAGIVLASAVFVPALWLGPVVGAFLVVALWYGQKGLPWLRPGPRLATG